MTWCRASTASRAESTDGEDFWRRYSTRRRRMASSSSTTRTFPVSMTVTVDRSWLESIRPLLSGKHKIGQHARAHVAPGGFDGRKEDGTGAADSEGTSNRTNQCLAHAQPGRVAEVEEERLRDRADAGDGGDEYGCTGEKREGGTEEAEG